MLYHHEWWNGKGYPYGLKGADIPREGRLLAIVDAFDAMTSDRPYRRSVSVDEALTEMRKQSSVCFDPEMVDVFIRSYTVHGHNSNFSFMHQTRQRIGNE